MGQTHEKNVNDSLVATLTDRPLEPVRPRTAVKHVKGAVVRAMTNHSVEAVETLVDIMRNGADKERLKAAVRILDYTIGKPSEQKESKEVLEEEHVTDVEFQELLNEDKEEELQDLIEERYDKKRKTKANRI